MVASQTLKNIIGNLEKNGEVKRFVIDEVHCMSHWGQDFRKDYLDLSNLKRWFPSVPILGLTATATEKVKIDIVQRLGIQHTVQYFQSSFNRPNLKYEIVSKKGNNTMDDIVRRIKTDFNDQCGIIYCLSRKDCEKVCKQLKARKITCDFYHADLSKEKRKEIQAKWMNDHIKIIIATIAFGMGINKKDVRFVIHYDCPKSLEGYV